MKSDNEMRDNNRTNNDNDMPDNRANSSQQEHSGQSKNDNDNPEQKKGRTYIKDMPEIKPARPGIM